MLSSVHFSDRLQNNPFIAAFYARSLIWSSNWKTSCHPKTLLIFSIKEVSPIIPTGCITTQRPRDHGQIRLNWAEPLECCANMHLWGETSTKRRKATDFLSSINMEIIPLLLCFYTLALRRDNRGIKENKFWHDRPECSTPPRWALLSQGLEGSWSIETQPANIKHIPLRIEQVNSKGKRKKGKKGKDRHGKRTKSGENTGIWLRLPGVWRCVLKQ